MSDIIDALDDALSRDSEEIILRRVVGTGAAIANIDVRCRAKITALSVEQLAAGIPATEMNLILSPTQINAAQWPGGGIPSVPPFNVDQRIPRAGVTDKVLMRGLPPKAVSFVNPVFFEGELVRINMRVAG